MTTDRKHEKTDLDPDKPEPYTTYKEVTIGKTIYRVTSVFLGEKDFKKALEDVIVRTAMADIKAGLGY